ncbi:MAG: HAD family hydrolase [Candidatus Limimorpha sp.]
MIKNIIFDFGGVLVDWNPHYLYDSYFNDKEKAEWFVTNVISSEWNAQMDGGKPFDVAVKERILLFPEYKEAIELYRDEWMKTMGDEIPGMYDFIKSLKNNGFPILYGLTNWSNETFPKVRETYRIFSLIDNIVVSGDEKLLKPNPEIYLTLASRYQLKPEECLFIDDNKANVKGAIDVGMYSILFQGVERLRTDINRLLAQ